MTNDLGNKEIFAKNLKRYLNTKGLTAKDLATVLEIPYTTVANWIQGNSYPRIDKIEMMANYFGISKSYLVEDPANIREREIQKMFHNRPELRDLFIAVEDCSEETIRQIIKIVEAIK